MGQDSAIEWTNHTFNPWTGCTKVSPACQHCYAEAWAKRSGVVQWGDKADRRRTSESNWRQPMKWNAEAFQSLTRKRVFCASLADVFEDREGLKPWRKELFALIQATPYLDWLLLTKRPENIARLMKECGAYDKDFPQNIWLGTTVENGDYLDRVDDLIEAGGEFASVLFLSCEPLLGYINLLTNQRYMREHGGYRPLIDDIQWVIGGFESGPNHREGDFDNARVLRNQCLKNGVPFFWKQNGGRTPKAGGCLLDGVEYKQFPKGSLGEADLIWVKQ